MIGILILVVFLSLLGKALLETICGGCQIIWGVICQGLGVILLALAYVLDFIERPKAARRRHGSFSHPVHMKTTIALLATLLVSTMPGISQEPTKTGAEKPTQTETTTTANTLPAARTITDTKGREMAGVIVAKTATGITFERAADRKRFEIQLDTLSDADKAFIAGIDILTPNKRKSVLYVIDWSNPEDYEKNHKEYVDWLKSNDYEVTIGLIHKFKTELGEPIKGETTKWLTPITMMDSFDIVWFQQFSWASYPTGTEFQEYDFFKLTNHRNAKRGIMVFRCSSLDDRKQTFLAPDGKRQGLIKKEKENYVRSEENWVFFEDATQNDLRRNGGKDSKPSIRSKLLREIEKVLENK